MKKFIDDLRLKLQGMDKDGVTQFMFTHTLKLTPLLEKEFGGMQNAVMVLGAFAVCAVLADGEFTDDEFELFKDKFMAFAGLNLDKAECEALFKYTSDEFQSALGRLSDFAGCLDDDGLEELVSVIMALFAVDGKIGDVEISWLDKLLAEADAV